MTGLTQNLGMLALGAILSAATAAVLLRIRRDSAGWALDHADEPRKTHEGAIPRIGGLVIFPAVLLSLLLADASLPVVIGAILLFLLGFGDDLIRLNSRRKLEAQVAVAILCYALGLRFDTLPSWSGAPVALPWIVALPLTVAWLAGWTNAMNLIDGLDGLATGIAMIGMAFLSLIVPEPSLVWGIAGAAAGFFGFNFPRARMFLGDGGAYLLGFLFGALALLGPGGRGVPFLITVLAVPLLDTIFAFGRRAWRRVPVMKGDAEHVHHQLRSLGLSSAMAVLLLHGMTILSGLMAWWACGLPGGGWAGIAWVFLAAGAGARYALRRSAPKGDDQNNSAKPASSSVVGSDTVRSSST